VNIIEVKKVISSFLDNSKSNTIPELGGIKIYDDPIIGFASGYDPLFIKLKDSNVTGEFHNTPREWFLEAVSVISYFLSLTGQYPRTRHSALCNVKIKLIFGINYA